MFGIEGGSKETFELFDTEDSGQVLLGRAWGQVEFDRCPAQGVDIEKADSGRYNVARAPSELTLGEQMVEIALNLLRGELIGRALVVGR